MPWARLPQRIDFQRHAKALECSVLHKHAFAFAGLHIAMGELAAPFRKKLRTHDSRSFFVALP